MKPNFVQKVTNWGNFPVVEKEMRSDDSVSNIKKIVRENNEVIARGNGRCYGDASLGEHIFSTKRLNKFVSFDRLNGVIECESGVLLSEILEISVPQGLLSLRDARNQIYFRWRCNRIRCSREKPPCRRMLFGIRD